MNRMGWESGISTRSQKETLSEAFKIHIQNVNYDFAVVFMNPTGESIPKQCT